MSERDDESQKMPSAEWIAQLNAAWPDIDATIRPMLRANLGSPGEAQDAVQDAYLRMRNCNDPDASRDIKGYAHSVAKRVLAQRLQKRARRQRTIEKFSAELQRGDENVLSPDRVRAAQEKFELVARVFEALPAHVQLAYEAVRFYGESVKSIAARLGVKEHTVYRYLRHAHEEFAKALASVGERDHD